MGATLDMARVTSKGQITIPVAVSRAPGVRAGDRVLFVENDDGSFSVQNATLRAFAEARETFRGAAAEAGLSGEDDVVALVRSVRRESAAV